ncbi:uncharacterized protein LOC130981219 [Arachis stenosperma]|uniref:uncharacterized protein LOC130981219 n=1 Tax=Arachis stenosperma TaxID=217475 RepID=UPI0025AD4990|nr:uncharacterized protein LOC130981219 [Arachis stenosperma]
MRLLMSSSDQDEGEMKTFANWILDVGNKNIGSVVGDESEIEISDDLLIIITDDPLSHLVDFAYTNLLQNMSDYKYFHSRAILAPTLESVKKVLKLYTNMMLLMSSLDQHDSEMKRFANWILDVENKNIGSDVGDESEIEILDDLLITTTDDPLSHLVDFLYPNLLHNMSDYRYFQSRTILAPTLESVETINDFVLTIFLEMEKEYLWYDTTCQANENEDVQQKWFTPDFLNDIKYSGLPNHKLTLKPGIAVMLLRNIDQTLSLYNGIRSIVNELGNNVIRAT